MAERKRPAGASPRRAAPKPANAPPRRPTVDPARRLAYDVLRAVSDRNAYANLVLPQLLRESRLDSRGRALATELGYGTLRSSGTLDALLAGSLQRPADQLQPELLDALRLGAYQLLSTRVPSHAAVSTTVDLVTAVLNRGAAGLANAALRSLSRRLDEAGRDLAVLVEDPALQTFHPAWILAAWQESLRRDGAEGELAAALAADNVRPQTHLVARSISLDDLLAEVQEHGLTGDAAPWSARGVRLDAGDPGALPSVRSGLAAVQDEGSQLMALALAAANTAEGLTLDSCAGPGGKAALLATLVDGPLLAVEVQPTRADLVRQALRHAANAEVTLGDGRTPPVDPHSARRVLVDAPCSGLGALRRRPEARWRKTPDDIAGLQSLQTELIVAGIDAAAPGATVAYVTCSPVVAETTEVVAAALRARPDVRLRDSRPLLPGVPDLGPGPHVQLWPHRHGTDAMFLQLLEI